MTTLFFQTDRHWSGLFLRLALGIMLFAHGAQLMLGWFGGNGFTATMTYFITQVGLPWLVAFAVIQVHFLGGLFLLAGFLTRPVALAVFGMFVGMILLVHLPHGFFMNWFGTKQSEGYEFHLLVLGMAASLLATGAGKGSIDRYLTAHKLV